MNYRPENWPEIKQAILPLRMESLDPELFKLIEAGADAILKELTKDAPYIEEGDYAKVECGWFTEGTVRISTRKFELEHLGPGWISFIPDEE